MTSRVHTLELVIISSKELNRVIKMQRLVDKIVNEFQQNSDYVEIGALDGNGGDV